MAENPHITYFGETDHRNRNVRFGIKEKDRARHTYIIGKTGTGKSTLLETLAIQDVNNGEGLAIIDPHGSFAERILEYIPAHRIDDVVYFAPFDLEYPIAFNVMENIGPDKRHLVASGLMSTFKKIWPDSFSARMEHMLNNTILALLEYPGSTLMLINKMFADKEFRNQVVAHITDPAVKSFWVDEFAKYTDRFAQEATPAIQNKIGQFTTNPVIRNIIGQPTSSFDFREIMDKKKIFIANLSKGRIGEQSMSLLGGTIITKIYLAAMERAEMSRDQLDKAAPFYFYVDEFQNFANEAFAQILSESRKYKLALTVANQYVAQMTEEVRDAILGNVGTMISFRIGPDDADIFEKQFSPVFVNQDLVNLGFAQVYLRLMIDGQESRPFSARTILPVNEPQPYRDRVIERSREQYAKPRAEVEKAIGISLEATKAPERKKEGDFSQKEKFSPAGNTKEQSSSFKPTSPSSYTTKGPTNAGTQNQKPNFPAPVNKIKEAFKNILPEKQAVKEVLQTIEKKVFEQKKTAYRAPEQVIQKEVTPQPVVQKNTFSSKMHHILRELEGVDELERNINNKEDEPKKGLSLSSLTKDKSASAEKVSSLKEALMKVSHSAQGEASKSQAPKPAPAPAPARPITPHVADEKKESQKSDTNKEVPEDVLRKLLDE
ncbi:MAG: type IV secretion system DNA-binding domain-containing protein [bacterium]